MLFALAVKSSLSEKTGGIVNTFSALSSVFPLPKTQKQTFTAEVAARRILTQRRK
jgi:hypothetical protein